MKRFSFRHFSTGCVLFVYAHDGEEAVERLSMLVTSPTSWIVEDAI